MNPIGAKNEYLKALEAAILIAHKCWPTHRGTIFVKIETDNDETLLWEGPVELFALAGHERATNCYAWQHIDANAKPKIVTVLENEFIDSATRAVQAAIFTDIQPPLPNRARALELLKEGLQKAGKSLHNAQIKTEDLDVAVESARQSREQINRSRKPPN